MASSIRQAWEQASLEAERRRENELRAFLQMTRQFGLLLTSTDEPPLLLKLGQMFREVKDG